MKGKDNIFLIHKTKPDETFPSNQFAISGFKFIGKDRNKFGVELLFIIMIN